MNTLKIRATVCGFLHCLRLPPALLALVMVAAPVSATTVIPPEFPELVRQADYVVRAVVKSVNSEWREKQGQRHIHTRVELEVREVITGTPPQPLILEMLGGKVGEDEMVVEGTPRFKVGDERILFVRGNGRQFFPLVALMHGSYPIKREPATGREYVVRSSGGPLFDESEVARPMGENLAAQAARPVAQALSPAEFTRRIRDQRDKNENRPQIQK